MTVRFLSNGKTAVWIREHGARESCAAVKGYDFEPSAVAFDAAFEE